MAGLALYSTTPDDQPRILGRRADFWGRRAEFNRLQGTIRARVMVFESTAVDYRPELSMISARAVVVTGRHDFVCGLVWAQTLHDGIAGSRLLILENNGHFGQVEQPDEFVEAVTWLLAAGDDR